ncbi:MAG: hypothetical protein HYZ84_02475 [Candidatus Omnitrophica bacterium]|nr:hypothetical protein [Candidatus Omnitrophota bacterium]
MKGKTLVIIGLLLVVTNAMTAAFISSRIPAAAPAGAVPAGGIAAPAVNREPPSPQIQTIVAALNNDTQGWLGLRNADKVASVEAMIILFRERENVAITKSPEEYVGKIDAMLSGNESMKTMTLPTLIKIAAVMEYDFYNGQDKEALAQQVLGDQLYQQNKARLGRP